MKTVQCPCGNTVKLVGDYQIKRKKYCSKACLYKYRVRPTGLKYVLTKKNPTSFPKGNKPWNKGLILEELASNWKGDNVGYDGLHDWVEKRAGKPSKCEHCGREDAGKYHWSNKSGEYKRDLSDWQRLCIRCHFYYDLNKFGARKNFRRYRKDWKRIAQEKDAV